jgi:GrpB-like predicted nucleotidyltransferase (UPF0157 family)
VSGNAPAGRPDLGGVLRAARAVQALKASVRNETREPIERKVRRWQLLRTPSLPECIQAVRPYDLLWPVRFQQERERLLALLGSGRVAALEHIGSTSIPGLASKSILDLLVAVKEDPLSPDLLARWAAAGYEPYGNSPCDHEAVWLWNTKGEGFASVAHVCADTNPWIRTALSFRDYMRAHPDECTGYEDLKHRLAAEKGRTLLEYSLEKLKAFYEISERADAWVAAGRPGGREKS